MFTPEEIEDVRAWNREHPKEIEESISRLGSTTCLVGFNNTPIQWSEPGKPISKLGLATEAQKLAEGLNWAIEPSTVQDVAKAYLELLRVLASFDDVVKAIHETVRDQPRPL